MSKPEPTDIMLEIGARLFPPRYKRFKDLRPYLEACEWARTLNWRENPYDRFLLKRELLHHLEDSEIHSPENIFAFASRGEIAAKVEDIMDEFSEEYESVGVFSYVLARVPWDLAFKHERVKYNQLTEALARMPVK